MPDMRFAPPNPLRIADRASGLNALSVRSYNERLVLSLLLQNEGISRMEIGERTGLSAQTVSVIVRSLEQEGLVAKGEAQRGRVGPPSFPLSLNPGGAYSVGISFGHRKIEIVLIDFIGTVQFQKILASSTPVRENQRAPLLDAIAEAIDSLQPARRQRVAGVGLAIPDGGGAAGSEGAESDLADLQRDIEQRTSLPVFVQNDITAAAGGESMFGIARSLDDYLFFYLGARLHSRLILNHQIYHGNSNLSFDVGILSLERELAALGHPTDILWERPPRWPDFGQALDTWLTNCSERVRRSIEALSQFVEVRTVVFSSFMPTRISRRICEDLERVLPGLRARPSGIGNFPKAVGAASLPFNSRFMVQ